MVGMVERGRSPWRGKGDKKWWSSTTPPTQSYRFKVRKSEQIVHHLFYKHEAQNVVKGALRRKSPIKASTPRPYISLI